MPVPAAEIAGGLHDFGLQFVGGGRGVLLEQPYQALLPKFFVIRVAGFSHSIGIEDDAITRLKPHSATSTRPSDNG